MNLKKMFAAQDMIVGPPWKRIKFLCRNSFVLPSFCCYCGEESQNENL